MSNIIDKIRISGTTYDLPVGISSGEVETMISAATSGYTARFAEDEEVTAAALNDLNENKQDKLSAGTGISISGNVISATGGSGGNPTVELTQAEYDALVSGGTVSADTYYIITDAQAGDLTNYYTKSETNTLLNGKQATLTAGRGISIDSGNTISLNVPISAGTGTNSIREGQNTTASGGYSHAEGGNSVASNYYSHAEGSSSVASGYNSHAEGEGTSATSLDSHAEGGHTKASGMCSHAEGSQTMANGSYSHAEGAYTKASGQYSHTEGYYTEAKNSYEHASGRYNVSRTGNTDADRTLFTVGNGTGAGDNSYNAFEIRQNDDIYIIKNNSYIKLQDNLGVTPSSAITSGDTNAVAGGAVYSKFDEVEQVTAAALNNINDRLSEDEEVTAAGLNAVNDKFGGLKLKKLTQAEYNALATKDASTLYVIVN